MKISQVLTSHDHLSNTGRKDRFLAGRRRGPVFRFRGCWSRAYAGFAERWSASDRSKERAAGKSDSRNGTVQER
jgi:hypothetical protein